MDTFTRISPQKAYEMIETGRVTVADIRDAGSFAEGHIAQAQMVNEENIKDFILGADKTAPLICYCYHGVSSQRAASYFINQGFKEVYSIDGGWEEWKNAYA